MIVVWIVVDQVVPQVLIWNENTLTGVKTPANPMCRDGYQKVGMSSCMCAGGWDCDCGMDCCRPGCTPSIDDDDFN